VHYESSDHFGLPGEVIERPDLRPAGSIDEPVRHVAIGRELEQGRFRAAFVWGHNPAVTVPDANRVRAGLARDDLFLVVHELFLTETAELADVVLPATAFVEQSDVYRSYNHRVLHYTRRACDPPHAQRSNVETFRALARTLGLAAEAWEDDEDALCHQLLEASRERFSDQEYERLLACEPVKLAPRKLADRGTPSGKIELVSELARRVGQPALATWVADDYAGGQGDWILIAAPSIATHNSTFSHSTRHAQRAGKPCVHLGPRDAAEVGVRDGDLLRLSNEQGALTLPARTSADMPRRRLRIDGLPSARDFPEGVGVNALVPGALSDLGAGNVLYSTRVHLARAN
jgi:anaerobic selenocysteine-containing dehydrogenase